MAEPAEVTEMETTTIPTVKNGTSTSASEQLDSTQIIGEYNLEEDDQPKEQEQLDFE